MTVLSTTKSTLVRNISRHRFVNAFSRNGFNPQFAKVNFSFIEVAVAVGGGITDDDGNIITDDDGNVVHDDDGN